MTIWKEQALVILNHSELFSILSKRYYKRIDNEKNTAIFRPTGRLGQKIKTDLRKISDKLGMPNRSVYQAANYISE